MYILQLLRIYLVYKKTSLTSLFYFYDIDGALGNWLSQGISSKDKFIYLWTQIANEFKNHNEYLIFESMDQIFFYDYVISILFVY